ncbi:FecR family protein [Novosphingobium resinovorum]|uniref:FecR family protein n=1 Tax=Novosphingobium resinovorum TaxID=158500 RepID=UPI002ED632AE|nr:FecR family protein [Novosphingobium resinovorum]
MTMPRETTSRTINREAAAWFAESEGGAMSAADAARMEDWLAADPLHARAYARAEMLWAGISRIDAASPAPELPPLRPKPTAQPSPRTARAPAARRAAWGKWGGGAIAAGVAALLVLGADLPVRLRADAMTATGEIRAVVLPDGSRATLDTGSAIAFSEDGRSVTLLRGQAAFQVAPDRAHPFSVTADGGTTTALGTRFIVRRADADTRVVVSEHSVRVALGARWATVREGQGLDYGDAGLGAPRAVAVADADAWTRGRIRVVRRPLGEVVAELARYHRGYIGVVDGELARRTVSGTFDVRDPLGALDVIQRTLGIRSTRLTDGMILIHA